MNAKPDTPIYIGRPDIPAGMTCAEFRRTLPRRVSWTRRVLRRRAA
jgi:hypothetical protein